MAQSTHTPSPHSAKLRHSAKGPTIASQAAGGGELVALLIKPLLFLVALFFLMPVSFFFCWALYTYHALRFKALLRAAIHFGRLDARCTFLSGSSFMIYSVQPDI
jgi:hypothetical protein